ncbi:MAG TPA: tRNA uridine-5-carboxymethylaminomethyl(34) synthesis enzyme MnmG [Gemmatimonadales bacterium]
MARHDVIVIGGGHAGVEAATAAARSGARTLLLTQNLETIGQMSCNPAIGGIAKGTVVREVDALGGVMARATDRARLQFRMLNRSKGPAVWSPRAQCDRGLYRRAVRSLLEDQPLVEPVQGTAACLILRGARVAGVATVDGRRYEADAVILTAGTFLRGRIHLGTDIRVPAGRAGEAPAVEIAQSLESLGLRTDRFKTGTPPRVDGRTVATERLQRQDSDSVAYWFSHFARPDLLPQLPCWLTWSGPALREIIESHLAESALYGGAIAGRGPRYCPSIEDKIVKFPDAERHQVFLEPEGLDTSEMYVNGLSTSLPAEIQLKFLRTVPGLEEVRMTRPGYAIEYDYFPPTQLRATLEHREIAGLFMAGQVNGTTGYEEAAGQGVVAGLNAAASALGRDPVVFPRESSFIGVLVDDLVHRGVDEPYRLFTSRSEFRLSIRQDNALRRMLPIARSAGILSPAELGRAEDQLRREEALLAVSRETSLSAPVANAVLEAAGSPPIEGPATLACLARRPGVSLGTLLDAAGLPAEDGDVEWPEIELKYEGYLRRERVTARKLREMEAYHLPALDYPALASLSTEARQKLAAARPATLGQASRIPGVSPSDVQALVMESLRARPTSS